VDNIQHYQEASGEMVANFYEEFLMPTSQSWGTIEGVNRAST
jgi:hypothetical protein